MTAVAPSGDEYRVAVYDYSGARCGHRHHAASGVRAVSCSHPGATHSFACQCREERFAAVVKAAEALLADVEHPAVCGDGKECRWPQARELRLALDEFRGAGEAGGEGPR